MSDEPMRPDAFEALYRDDPDPWGYRERPYERAKYADTLRACGPGPFAVALELGGSIGEFTALLAPRCQLLRTLDASPTAVALAQARLASLALETRPAPGSPRDRVPPRDADPHSSADDTGPPTAADDDVPAPDVEALLGTVPDDLPPGPFDLVVASEILYYLAPPAFDASLAAISSRLAPGGRLVAVHYVPPGPERPLSATAIHAALRAQPWLSSIERSDRGDYLLDVLEATRP